MRECNTRPADEQDVGRQFTKRSYEFRWAVGGVKAEGRAGKKFLWVEVFAGYGGEWLPGSYRKY